MFSLYELILLGVGAAFLLWLFGGIGRAARSHTLVLKKFVLNDTPGSQVLVEIQGRAAGFLGWLLALLHLGADTSLLVTDRQIVFRKGSLGGEHHSIVPLSAVSSTHCGFAKPLWALVVGLLLIMWALFGLLGVMWGAARAANTPFFDSTPIAAGLFIVLLETVIAGALIVYYYVSRRLTLTVESEGGLLAGLVFKRSLVENATIDLPQTMGVVRTINTRVMQMRSLHTV